MTDLKRELANREKGIAKLDVEKENLKRRAQKLQEENLELLSKVNYCESKISEVEFKVKEPPVTNSKSTNTDLDFKSSTGSQCESDGPTDGNCPHVACYLRQPTNPQPTGLRPGYVHPSSNIRLVSRSVHSFQSYRALQIIHECNTITIMKWFSILILVLVGGHMVLQ